MVAGKYAEVVMYMLMVIGLNPAVTAITYRAIGRLAVMVIPGFPVTGPGNNP
jgi:p-aminobenzoyl-glutamate transporter AbgT